MADRGKLIVIEGPDGSGKSTIAHLLHARRLAGRRPSILTREPTDGPVGKLIRRALRAEVTLAPAAMGPLYAADRANHAATLLQPALARGEVVVCDRYLLSNLVYRGAEQPVQRCWRCSWESWENHPVSGATHCLSCGVLGPTWPREESIIWARTLSRGAPRPDLTIVLTAPLELCAARRRARGGAAELYDDTAMQARVHALYADAQRLLPSERVAMVDASGSAEEVEAAVWQAAKEVLGG